MGETTPKIGGKVGSHDGHPLDTANYQDFGVALGGYILLNSHEMMFASKVDEKALTADRACYMFMSSA